MVRNGLLIIFAFLVLNSISMVRVYALSPQEEIAMGEIFDAWPTQLTGLGWSRSTISNACDYGGVGCTDGQITGLNLTGTGLTGTIPTAIGSLPTLSYLDLSDNYLTGTIPPTVVSHSAQLNVVILRGNNLNGTIPTEIGNQIAIRKIDFSDNGLTGSIPESLSSLSNLVYLNLSLNGLTSSIPESIHACPLEILDLSQNNLGDSIPNRFISSPLSSTLRVLVLSDNLLEGELPSKFNTLSQLQTLRIDNNPFSGNTLSKSIVSLSTLQYLSARNAGFSGPFPGALASRDNLIELDLAGNLIQSEIPNNWSASNLRRLVLSDNDFSGTLPSSLGSLPQLSILDLSYNALTGPIPVEIGSITTLKELNISYNSLSGSLPATISGATELISLDLSNNNLSGTIPSLSSLAGLQKLNLNSNSLTLCPRPALVSEIELCDLTNQYVEQACACSALPQCSYSVGLCNDVLPVDESPAAAVVAPACPSPIPSSEFVCEGGVWVLVGNLSLPSLTVSSPIKVIGHLDVSAFLTFTGLSSSISAVNGCITVGGYISLALSSDDLKLLQQGRTEYTILTQDANCANSVSSLQLQTSGKDGCRKLKATSSPNNSRARLSTLLEVDASSCNTRWIILGSVLGGVVLIFTLAVLVHTKVPSITKVFAPYARTNM